MMAGRRIRDLPPAGRPRERLLEQGAAALSEAELLAVLFGTGDARRSAVGLAEALLAAHATPDEPTGLHGLGLVPAAALQAEPGLGPAKAARLAAAFELGNRAAAARAPIRAAIKGPADAWRLLAPRLERLDREHFLAILLDSKHNVLDVALVAIGTLNATLVHPREVFKPAVRASAAAVVLAHNHPSGDPTPSPEDRALTAQLLAAGEIMGIRVMDHVVVGHGRYASLRETSSLWRDQPFHR
ncbi:MAG: radC [Cyanobacteria bacterium RYN_339]|nr:radC [Cyanobacteria bacterium RYN_339]